MVTNHLLHGRPSLDDLPEGDDASDTYVRARRLTAAVAARTGPLSPEQVKEVHACVHREEPGVAVRTPGHGHYDAIDRSPEVSFYLGDDLPGGVRRSPYLRFGL